MTVPNIGEFDLFTYLQTLGLSSIALRPVGVLFTFEICFKSLYDTTECLLTAPRYVLRTDRPVKKAHKP